MTKPTQAQIEAATRAVRKSYFEDGGRFDEMAYAALTAAAVGECDLKCTNGHDLCYMGVSDDCPYCERVPLTAAAEAKPKPAQSQIEAVKDTLRRLVILTGDSPWDWDDVARKVLAAAAEVGNGKCVNAHMGGERCVGKCMNPKDCCETPLAAEVGEQYNPEMVEKILAAEKATPEATIRPGELMDYLDAPEKEHSPEWHIIQATIERCAQVVKDAADRHDSPMGCEPYTRAQLLEIYAAIRALKENP